MGMVNKTLRLQKLNELLKHNDGYLNSATL